MKRIDISMERTRVYGYQDRNLEIDNPLMLFITEEGGHRVQDTDGWVHYVPKKWQTLKWLPKIQTHVLWLKQYSSRTFLIMYNVYFMKHFEDLL